MDKCENIGFPIAEIEQDGTSVITKEPGTGGEVFDGTVSSQPLYDIQGPLYDGSDVTANLEDIVLTDVGPDRVQVSGARGHPTPRRPKVGLTAFGGFQAEFHYYLVGLDLEEKAEWTEKQKSATYWRPNEGHLMPQIQSEWPPS